MKKINRESRLPHKWAIDFRNMHTAIHGLFYGDDIKVVNQFYKELQSLDTDDANYEWDLMGIIDGFEGDIERIDEINYREISKLPSGRYGIEIDGVEYWIINNVSEDLYMESSLMKEAKDTVSKDSFLPYDVVNNISEDDIDAFYNNVFIEFMNGDNSILTWRGSEEIQEAFGLSEKTMNSIISYWKKLRNCSKED